MRRQARFPAAAAEAESHSSDGSDSGDGDSALDDDNGNDDEAETEEVDVPLSDIITFDAVEPMWFVDALRLMPEFGPGIFDKPWWEAHHHELGNCVVREHNPVVKADIASGNVSFNRPDVPFIEYTCRYIFLRHTCHRYGLAFHSRLKQGRDEEGAHPQWSV